MKAIRRPRQRPELRRKCGGAGVSPRSLAQGSGRTVPHLAKAPELEARRRPSWPDLRRSVAPSVSRRRRGSVGGSEDGARRVGVRRGSRTHSTALPAAGGERSTACNWMCAAAGQRRRGETRTDVSAPLVSWRRRSSVGTLGSKEGARKVAARKG